MHLRSFLLVGCSVLLLFGAAGGLLAQDPATPDAPAPPRSTGVEDEKALLARLVAELERSSRSFIYLRSVGFTQSDQEFEKLIVRNNRILRPTRIVRSDAQGNRQTPGWPGVKLAPEFKSQRH